MPTEIKVDSELRVFFTSKVNDEIYREEKPAFLAPNLFPWLNRPRRNHKLALKVKLRVLSPR